jgi:hypothetical protein
VAPAACSAPGRHAWPSGAAVVRALEHETAVGRDELHGLLGDALEQAALVELVGEPGRGGQQAIEGVGLCAQLLAQRALGLDVPLCPLTRAAGADDECREHPQGDRKQDVQNDCRPRAWRGCGARGS